MKTKIHAIAGTIAFITIFLFWTSTVISELFGSHETIAFVKTGILKGMFLLIPAMIIVGGSGMSMAGQSNNLLIIRKKKRMPIIAITGLSVLLPAAFYLQHKAITGEIDIWFYSIQVLELVAGASNLTLMFKNMKDGLRVTGKLAKAGTRNQSEAKQSTIHIKDNGPILVKDATTIIDTKGHSFALKKNTALCRCGASKNKPYCDGQHNNINFNSQSKKSETSDKLNVYHGDEIDVFYNKSLCSHAGICGSQLNTVFDTKKKPWINPNNADVEAIKEVVKTCPSGALQWSKPGKNPEHLVADGEVILVEENGPYHIKNINLENQVQSEHGCENKYVLCRCGKSKNKPFCDGSHSEYNWQGE